MISCTPGVIIAFLELSLFAKIKVLSFSRGGRGNYTVSSLIMDKTMK